MKMTNLKKIRLNDSKEYDLFYIDRNFASGTTGKIVVRGQLSQLPEIASDFSSINKIVISSESGDEQIITERYQKYQDLSVITDTYYNDDEKKYEVGYGIVLKETTLEEKVKRLDAQVNPVIDYDALSIAEYRKLYIDKTKESLAEYLEQHPITSTAHGGVAGVYSVTKEKQDLMASNYLSYTLEKAANPDAVLTWNETGKECEVWTEEEFIQLIIEIKQYVQPLVSHQQKLETQINSMSKSDISSLVISYEDIS